jgi:hypothetical protein
MSLLFADTARGAPPREQAVRRSSSFSQTVKLSASRTYDRALEALGAYKLTGNFPAELEIALKDMRVFDRLTFDIKPKPTLSDCREVEFRPRLRIREQSFEDAIRRIEGELGTVGKETPFWTRLFR